MALATRHFDAAERTQHRVLVVSADAAARQATCRTLRAAGFPVTEAASAAEGLSCAAQGFSAVVLDVEMPELDGFRFCRTLRANQNTARLPVLFMSAPGISSQHTRVALDAGADACLVYPVDAGVLLAMTQALVRVRGAELASSRPGGCADAGAEACRALARETAAIEQAAWSVLEHAVNDSTLAAMNHILRSTRQQAEWLRALGDAPSMPG